MHDAFRLAGRTGRKHHIKRMIEFDLFKCDFFRTEGGQEIITGNAAANAGRVGAVKGIFDNHNLLDRRDSVNYIANLFSNVVAFAVIVVAIDRNHEFGFDLAKPVNDALNTEVGGGR